jgi:hypothetical protein
MGWPSKPRMVAGAVGADGGSDDTGGKGESTFALSDEAAAADVPICVAPLVDLATAVLVAVVVVVVAVGTLLISLPGTTTATFWVSGLTETSLSSLLLLVPLEDEVSTAYDW